VKAILMMVLHGEHAVSGRWGQTAPTRRSDQTDIHWYRERERGRIEGEQVTYNNLKADKLK